MSTPDAARRVLTFAVGGERLAIDAGAVAEVVAAPPLTRVPHALAALAGLASVRGRVMPIVSLSAILGGARTQSGGRVIVLQRDEPVGLAVDQVSAMRSVAGAGEALTDGAIERVETEEGPARLLRLEPLLAQAFSGLARAATQARREPAVNPASGESQADTQLAFLTVGLAGQTFALPLDQVREVAPIPPSITRLPDTDAVMVGVMSLRGVLTPLVSLRALLGLGPALAAGHVVIAVLGETRIGLVVDDVRMILRVPAENVGATPSVLNRGAGEARITALARTPGGLVSILAMERVLRDDTVAQVLAEGAGRATDDEGKPEESKAVEQFVLFTLGGETYGLPIAAVDAVLRLPEQLTRVPKAPAFVAGVMNHRGAVTPVIDQRRRFGVEGEAPAERRRVIVTRLDDVTVGFIVDGVERILDLPVNALTPAPDLAADEVVLFDRIATVELDGRLVLLVDPRQLLDQAERDVVRAVAGQTAGQGSATG